VQNKVPSKYCGLGAAQLKRLMAGNDVPRDSSLRRAVERGLGGKLLGQAGNLCVSLLGIYAGLDLAINRK
jgi:hypothetical protein